LGQTAPGPLRSKRQTNFRVRTAEFSADSETLERRLRDDRPSTAALGCTQLQPVIVVHKGIRVAQVNPVLGSYVEPHTTLISSGPFTSGVAVDTVAPFLTVILTVIGAAVNVAAAVWLLAASNPDNERYTDDGTRNAGPQRSQVVPASVRDQRKIAALTMIGTTILVVAAILDFAVA
jgi:hypothetical protein